MSSCSPFLFIFPANAMSICSLLLFIFPTNAMSSCSPFSLYSLLLLLCPLVLLFSLYSLRLLCPLVLLFSLYSLLLSVLLFSSYLYIPCCCLFSCSPLLFIFSAAAMSSGSPFLFILPAAVCPLVLFLSLYSLLLSVFLFSPFLNIPCCCSVFLFLSSLYSLLLLCLLIPLFIFPAAALSSCSKICS